MIWLSREAVFAEGQPIRGGIPICWPWFGSHPEDSTKPAHGLARILEWELTQAGGTEEGAAALDFVLVDSEWTRSLWPYPFELSYRVSLHADGLDLRLQTKNTGPTSLRFSAALHSYFAVRSIETARVVGLDGVSYADQLDGMAIKQQSGPVVFDREVDRIYQDAPTITTLEGSVCDRAVGIRSKGSRSTVVWNPWIEKSKRMPDFGDQEFRETVCIETANAGRDDVVVEPGATHTLGALIGLCSV